jgi:hypothetical protein
LQKKTTSGSEIIYVCKLPSGVAKETLSPATKVRPIVLGVRLEKEAASPVSVTLETLQVLKTDEMQSQPPDTESVRLLSKSNLKPYRVSQTTAAVKELPYPMHTAPQSVMGIISFEQVKRWEDKARATRVYNIAVAGANRAMETNYLSKFEAYKNRQIENAALDDMLTGAGSIVQVAVPSSMPMFNMFRKQIRRENKAQRTNKPTHTKPFTEQYPPAPPSTGTTDDDAKANTKNFVIGGRKKSAARELADMFDVLTQHCLQAMEVLESAKNELDDAKERQRYGLPEKGGLPNASSSTSVRYRLHSMRQSLLSTEDSKTCALFDALLTSEPYPVAKELLRKFDIEDFNKEDLYTNEDKKKVGNIDASRFVTTDNFRRRYTVCGDVVSPEAESFMVTKNEDNGLQNLSAPEKNEIAEMLENEQKKEMQRARDTNAPFMFLYERLRSEHLKKTLVRTVYRLRVVDHDMDDFVVDIESSEEYGMVANSVYSEHVSDIFDLDKSAMRFVDAMFSVYTNENWKDMINSFFKRNNKGIPRKVPRTLKKAFKLLIIDAGNFELKDLFFSNTLDVCLLEDRVAEIRFMCREILPIWPPVVPIDADAREAVVNFVYGKVEQNLSQSTPDASPQTNVLQQLSKLRAGKTAVERADYGETRRRMIEAISLSHISSAETNSGDNDMEKGSEEKSNNSVQIRLVEKLKELQKAHDDKQDVTRLSTEVNALLAELASKLDNTRLARLQFSKDEPSVQRILPQILVPDATSLPRFEIPANPDPPPNYLPSIVMEVYANGGFFSRLSSSYIFVKALTLIFTYKAYKAIQSLYGLYLFNAWKFKQIKTLAATGAAAADPLQAAAIGIAIQILSDRISKYINMYNFFGNEAKELTRQVIQNTLSDVQRRFAYNIAKNVIGMERERRYKNQMRMDLYKIARRDVLMIPVASAITAANEAIRLYRENLQKEIRKDELEDTDIYLKRTPRSIATSHLDGTRIRFYELYADDYGIDLRQLEGAVAVHGTSDWSSVPDGTSLKLFPPRGVSDALYDALVLRDVPVDKAIVEATGNVSGETSPAELAAKAAFSEVVQAVYRGRRNLKGEHLMKSAPLTIFELVKGASELLERSYGVASGVTLVEADDAVWTCFAGGVVARLSVRHFGVFADSENVDGATPSLRAVKYWKRERRAMMSLFAQALLNEAQLFVKEQPKAPVLYDANSIKAVSAEAVRSFARTAILTTEDAAGAVAMVVASSVAHKLFMSNESSDHGLTDSILTTIASEESKANTFKDQQSYSLLPRHSGNDHSPASTWASRRLDIGKYRSADVGIGADRLTDSLAALSIESRFESNAVYYVPMGMRMQSLPSHTSFDVHGASLRVVWMDRLSRCASYVRNAIMEELKSLCDNDDGKFVGIKVHRLGSGKVSGFARHPLTLESRTSSLKTVVHVGLCEYTARSYLKQSSSCLSLTSAVRKLQTFEDNNQFIQQHVHSMREIAYNAERLTHCISLAHSLELSHSTNTLCVDLQSERDTQAFTLALAMHDLDDENANKFSAMRISLNGGSVHEANRLLNGLEERCISAYKAGCRVMPLSEVALCI